MTIKSMNELLAQADATIQDNTTGDITAAEVRNLVKDFIDSVRPNYGVISCTSTVETLSATPQLLAPFTATNSLTVGAYTSNLTNGSVTRLVAGHTPPLTGATDFITIDGSVEGANNALVTMALYKNGAPTGFELSMTTQGASRPVGINFAGLIYTDSSSDAVYDVRAYGDAGSFTFLNVLILCQSQPVGSYT